MGTSAEGKRKASVDQIKCLSSECKLRFSQAWWPEKEVWFPCLSPSHSSQQGAGKKELPPLPSTFGSWVPWNADSPLPITHFLLSFVPHYHPGILPLKRQDQRRWVDITQPLRVSAEVQALPIPELSTARYLAHPKWHKDRQILNIIISKIPILDQCLLNSHSFILIQKTSTRSKVHLYISMYIYDLYQLHIYNSFIYVNICIYLYM